MIPNPKLSGLGRLEECFKCLAQILYSRQTRGTYETTSKTTCRPCALNAHFPTPNPEFHSQLYIRTPMTTFPAPCPIYCVSYTSYPSNITPYT